jgi:hypothetical protein
MEHSKDCGCVICTEWSGRMPIEIEIPDEDFPNFFDEVLGG